MLVASLLLTPQAEKDLEEIFHYTFDTWGLTQAELYQDEQFNTMHLILANLKMGATYSHATSEYRSVHVNKHLIFYRIDRGNCIVVRILHERMNPSDHF